MKILKNGDLKIFNLQHKFIGAWNSRVKKPGLLVNFSRAHNKLGSFKNGSYCKTICVKVLAQVFCFVMLAYSLGDMILQKQNDDSHSCG